METIKMEDITEPTSDSTVEETSTEASTTEQDPLTQELERVQKKEGRTELEKATFSLKKNAERLKELGGDPKSILGVDTEAQDEDDTPLTVGMLKKMQHDSAAHNAFQLAEEIENSTERELTKYHLENSIKSTGNPTEDLNLARAIVNAAKNSQILEEVARQTSKKTHSSASSAPLNHDAEVELTSEELLFTQAPFYLTKEDILKARKK